ncbi:MAG: hypothetical protein JWQ27_3173 [Ferruginibacter sp.]|nr:hypothetical protein [Ferruginibacter sp.]
MRTLIFLLLIVAGFPAFCQEEPVRTIRGNNPAGTVQGEQAKKDTNMLGFEHRKDDSLTLTYRYIDSTSRHTLDSSVNDFDNYYPVPSSYLYLGNNGAAAKSLIFKPYSKPGWDAGFHAFDIYRFKLEDTKFYKANRPFSMLGYQLASGKEQMIKAAHTQNPSPNLNVGFDYRLITAPGFFVTSNNSHNSYRVFSTYTGNRKRYNGNLVLVGNTIKASQNGGLQNDSSLLDPNKKERFSVPVNLGNAAQYAPNPFQASVKTGNVYKDFTFFLRQSYDLGKRDSVEINDSTTEYLFYPKLRVQHSFTFSNYNYNFTDIAADSLVYANWYHVTIPDSNKTFLRNEKWSVISNDFSLIQFPDTKNAAQFFLAGATLQNIKGTFTSSTNNFYNVMLHGEYRNRTRNKLWDILLKGEFYLNGLNGGDYAAYGSLSRYLNKQFGDIRLFFNNSNRTPSFIYDNRSSFNLGSNNNFNKENITSFGATASNPFIQLGFTNHLLTNYSYFTDYYHTAQYGKIINILQVSASKKIAIGKRWNYYIDATAQKTDDNAPVKVPLLYTRQRLAFEGQYYKNLNLSAGLEVRYFTPYKMDNYSPVVGQFMPQDTMTIKNLPDVAAFVHFRIKGFTAYLRAENLNTVSFRNGFAFVNNNFAAPHYPTQGMAIRFGIQWWFIN